jgi:hypothetical protein
VLAAAFIASGADCPTDWLTTLDVTDGAASQPMVVMLRITNASGVPAEVEATFYAADNPVRETTRVLAAGGVESTEIVVPTATDLIRILATQSAPPPNARVGDVLADTEIIVGPEVVLDGIIDFVIPAFSFTDCNHNGIHDANDISDGTSEDCNVNGIPDECESPTHVHVVYAEQQKIWMTDEAGSAPTLLVDLTPPPNLGAVEGIALDVPGGRILFTMSGVSTSEATVRWIPLGGGADAQLVPAMYDGVSGLCFDPVNDEVYWGHISSTAVISVADGDGNNAADFVTTGTSQVLEKPYADPLHGRLYFTRDHLASTVDSVQRVDLADGSNQVSVITDANAPRDLEVWAERNLMFWTEYRTGGGVFRASLAGNNKTQIATSDNALGVAIDRANCKVYWCAEGSGANVGFVQRMDLDGGDPVMVRQNLDLPRDVAVYPGS